MATDQHLSIMKTVQNAETRSRWVAASRAGGRRTAGEKLEEAELVALPNLEDAEGMVPDDRGADEYDMGVDVIGVGCHVDEYAVGAEGSVGEMEGTPRVCR